MNQLIATDRGRFHKAVDTEPSTKCYRTPQSSNSVPPSLNDGDAVDESLSNSNPSTVWKYGNEFQKFFVIFCRCRRISSGTSVNRFGPPDTLRTRLLVDSDQQLPLKADCATQFVELLTANQRKLYAYICTLMFGDTAAVDVLQETNLALWSRASEYDFTRPFVPWAFGFARNRVAEFRRTQSRSRLLFTDDVLNAIDEDCVNVASMADTKLLALHSCLKKLNQRQAKLIRDRYGAKASVKKLAGQLETTATNVASQLYRVRKLLAKCIEATLAMEE